MSRYNTLRQEIYYLVLKEKTGLQFIIDRYAYIQSKGKSIAKICRGFNAKNNANNKRLVDKLTNAINSKTPAGS